jgi:hypothetical protein
MSSITYYSLEMCKRTIIGKGPEEERETKKTKEKDKRVERKSEKTSDKGSRKEIERRDHFTYPRSKCDSSSHRTLLCPKLTMNQVLVLISTYITYSLTISLSPNKWSLIYRYDFPLRTGSRILAPLPSPIGYPLRTTFSATSSPGRFGRYQTPRRST